MAFEKKLERLEKEKEKEKETPDNYVLVEVPTGSALAIQTPEGKVLSQEQAIVEILNIVEEIRKGVA